MIYAFDLDGTICSTPGVNMYDKAEPLTVRIKLLNKLHGSGHTIKIFTSRPQEWKQLTENQLKKWEVKYHELILGKPVVDMYVDDHAINAKAFFNNIGPLWA